MAEEVKYIQNQAGFNLRNWISNKNEVVCSLENLQASNEKQLNMGSDKDVEKVLGVFWNPANDTITFKVSPYILSDDA